MSDVRTRLPAQGATEPVVGGGLREDKVEGVVSTFREAYDARDIDAVVELFAEDGDWSVSLGTFTGEKELRRLLEWDVGLSPSLSSREFGMGLVAKGNLAVNERVIEQKIESVRIAYPVLTAFELNDVGKIQHARSYYDKLGILRQVANELPGIKGWFFKTLVNFVAAQGEKGIERPHKLT